MTTRDDKDRAIALSIRRSFPSRPDFNHDEAQYVVAEVAPNGQRKLPHSRGAQPAPAGLRIIDTGQLKLRPMFQSIDANGILTTVFWGFLGILSFLGFRGFTVFCG